MDEIEEIIEELSHSRNFRFQRLLTICGTYFGEARTVGSHYIFRTPWQGNPRINLQKDKSGKAKAYQVRQVIRALERLMETLDEEENETE